LSPRLGAVKKSWAYPAERQARLGTAVPRGGSHSLITLPTWILKILVSEDVSSHKNIGGFLQV